MSDNLTIFYLTQICPPPPPRNKTLDKPGASPGFGRRGAKNIFFRFGNLHVAKRHAAHGEAMRFVRGVRGMPPREFFFKMVQFGAFWCIF